MMLVTKSKKTKQEMREEGELRIIQPSPPDWVTPPPLLLCHSPTHSSFNPNIYIHPGFRLQKNPLLRGIKIRMYKKQKTKKKIVKPYFQLQIPRIRVIHVFKINSQVKEKRIPKSNAIFFVNR